MGRPRNFAVAILFAQFGDTFLQDRTVVERPRLLRRPGADLAAPRPFGKIGIGFVVADDLDRPAQPHLTAQRLPVHHEGRLAAGLDLLPLGAGVVGVEDEGATARPPGLDLLQQHHPRIGQARRIHRRQRDSIGIVRLCRFRLCQPVLRDAKRIFASEDPGPVCHGCSPMVCGVLRRPKRASRSALDAGPPIA